MQFLLIFLSLQIIFCFSTGAWDIDVETESDVYLPCDVQSLSPNIQFSFYTIDITKIPSQLHNGENVWILLEPFLDDVSTNFMATVPHCRKNDSLQNNVIPVQIKNLNSNLQSEKIDDTKTVINPLDEFNNMLKSGNTDGPYQQTMSGSLEDKKGSFYFSKKRSRYNRRVEKLFIDIGEIEMGDYEILQKYSKDSDIAKLDQSFFERSNFTGEELIMHGIATGTHFPKKVSFATSYSYNGDRYYYTNWCSSKNFFNNPCVYYTNIGDLVPISEIMDYPEKELRLQVENAINFQRRYSRLVTCPLYFKFAFEGKIKNQIILEFLKIQCKKALTVEDKFYVDDLEHLLKSSRKELLSTLQEFCELLQERASSNVLKKILKHSQLGGAFKRSFFGKQYMEMFNKPSCRQYNGFLSSFEIPIFQTRI